MHMCACTSLSPAQVMYYGYYSYLYVPVREYVVDMMYIVRCTRYDVLCTLYIQVHSTCSRSVVEYECKVLALALLEGTDTGLGYCCFGVLVY